ncbi:MAG: hypothetical protein E3J83_03485 [Candidatus Atribacteria bacterium]|nr:MAG: hypothetical protein E3J83_03485 [Candidatus Atribacteria bacterium]
MRKLNVTQYEVKVLQADGTYKEIPYNVKESIVQLMFHPDLGLGGVALLKQNEIAEKILKAGIDVLLEEEEYNKVRFAVVDNFKGYTQNEVELVKRVTECQEVKVKEKK